MVFSKNLWEFSVLSNLRWQNIHPNLFELLRGPAGARLHTTTTAQLLTFLGGLVVVVDEVSWTEKKGSKKNDSLYGKLRFSRDETCLVIKLRCYLRVEYVLLKTNMFANGWRLAITDFVRTGGFCGIGLTPLFVESVWWFSRLESMDILAFHWYFLRQESNACMIRTTQLFNNFCKICLADTDFELFNSHCFLFLYSFDS